MYVRCLALVLGEPCIESGARAKCLGGCLVALVAVAVAGSSGRVGVCTKRCGICSEVAASPKSVLFILPYNSVVRFALQGRCEVSAVVAAARL